jgi:Co/Zn/Cd efflux system component
MGAGCCEAKGTELDKMRESHSRVLKAVLAINLIMFVTEFAFGWIGNSTSLMGDSLDMLGDAVVYAMSLYFIASNEQTQARVTLLKGGIMVTLGLVVLVEAAFKSMSDVMPVAQTMGWVGGLALAANTYCLWALTRYRNDDLNMRSVWICSRNDIIANTSVLVTAILVATLQSKWPDIVVGSAIALLFIGSGFGVLKAARTALNPRIAS